MTAAVGAGFACTSHRMGGDRHGYGQLMLRCRGNSTRYRDEASARSLHQRVPLLRRQRQEALLQGLLLRSRQALVLMRRQSCTLNALHNGVCCCEGRGRGASGCRNRSRGR